MPHRNAGVRDDRRRAPRALGGMGGGVSQAVSTPLLQVKGAKVTYPPRHRGGLRVQSVDGVDLEIATGEVVALVGESGCGKTTLARAVLGLQPMNEGSIS